jgi:hypothetical protein
MIFFSRSQAGLGNAFTCQAQLGNQFVSFPSATWERGELCLGTSGKKLKAGR